MYSNFLYDDKDAFSDLFVDISEEDVKPEPEEQKKAAGIPVFGGLKSLFLGFGSGGILTTLLLFYILSDCDEDEQLIILALYFLMGL